MRLEQHIEHGVLIIKPLEKRLEARLTEEFRAHLTRAIETGSQLVLLDLSAVTFLDSNSLSALVLAFKLIGAEGRIALTGLAEPIMHMFHITGLDRAFEIFGNSQEAVTTLSGQQKGGICGAWANKAFHRKCA